MPCLQHAIGHVQRACSLQPEPTQRNQAVGSHHVEIAGATGEGEWRMHIADDRSASSRQLVDIVLRWCNPVETSQQLGGASEPLSSILRLVRQDAGTKLTAYSPDWQSDAGAALPTRGHTSTRATEYVAPGERLALGSDATVLMQGLHSAADQFISGVPVSSSTQRWIEVRDPSTQRHVNQVPETTCTEFDAAVESSKLAFFSWRTRPIPQRQRVMHQFLALIHSYKDDLAECITREQGKTLSDAHGDVFRGLEVR